MYFLNNPKIKLECGSRTVRCAYSYTLHAGHFSDWDGDLFRSDR